MVIEALHAEEINDAAMNACFGIAGAIDDTGNTGMHDGAGTHGARFQCDKQFTAG